MIATRIGPDMRMLVVGSPACVAQRAIPRTLRDLTDHACNNLRLPTNGGLYVREFKKGDESLNVRVLDDWCAPFAGVHLYYPNRRQASPAFALLVDALRYRG
jgi:hypothetical protein